MAARTVAFRLRILVSSLALLFCLVTKAEGEHVTFFFILKSSLEQPVRGSLVASPMLATHEQAAPPSRQFEIEIPGRTTIDLAPGWTWKIELEVAGFWAPPEIHRAGMGKEATIELLPTGRIRGKAVVEPQSGTLDQIELRFSEKSFRHQEIGSLRGTMTCPISKDRIWECEVPLGVWDLRLRAPDYVAHYFWDQRLERDQKLDLGEGVWRQGSSLAGWIKREDEQPLSPKAKVSLFPQISAASPHGNAKLRVAAQSERVSDHGFFQIKDLAPGTYRLEAEEPGLAEANLEQVIILPDQEATLVHPILLQRPISPTFQVIPAESVGGGTWQIDLLSQFPDPDVAASGATDPQGFWRPGKVAPGRYLLTISDEYGDRKVFEELTLGPETEFLFEIPVVWVAGRVHLGDEGVPASLYFGGRHGAVSVRMDADEEGEFSGVLNREGDWKVQILARHPAIFRTLHQVAVETEGDGAARVDIELPDTLIEVEVVDETGTPVPGARVLLMRRTQPSEVPSWGDTDGDGLFELRGLGFAEYRVEAHLESPKATFGSDSVEFQLSSTSPSTNTRLVLRKKRELIGRVLSPLQIGVPGAQVSVRGVGQGESVGMSLLIPQTFSEADGTFQLSLPAAMQRARIFVLAPGYVLRVLDISLDTPETLEIAVTQIGGGELVLQEARHAQEAFWEGPRVTYEGYLPLNWTTLLNWARMNGQATDGEGLLRVPGMPVGRYEICASSAAQNCTTHLLSVHEVLPLFVKEKASSSSNETSKGEVLEE